MLRIPLSILGFAILAATSISATPISSMPTGKIATSQSDLTIRYASGFSVVYREGYKIVSVNRAWPGSTEKFEYVLYPRNTIRPQYKGKATFIETPLRRVVSYSTTYLPQIIEAGGLESIIGVDNAANINSPDVQIRIATQKTVETTKNWIPNIELLIMLNPDAIFTYGVGNEWDYHPKLIEAGLPVIIDGEWNEADPLARAEWLKFIALFYNAEAAAEIRFNEIEKEYLRIKNLASNSKSRPKILVNAPFQGIWVLSGGKSYQARFITDAGGAYLWANDPSSGGISLSVESAFERGMNADIWINPGIAKKLEDVVAMDQRFTALPALSRGAVWGNVRRINDAGANDYYELGVMRPDLILADLVRIFHPELDLGGEMTFYMRLK